MLIDTQASFNLFVYPFTFDPETFQQRCDGFERARFSIPRKASAKSRAQESNQSETQVPPLSEMESVPVWEFDQFEMSDLLPHVEQYLNPFLDPKASTLQPPTAYLWKLQERLLQSPQFLGCQLDWKICTKKNSIAFKVSTIQLCLFCDGVGFVTVHANPKSDDVEEWLDFAHNFRFAEGQRDTEIFASRRTGRDSREFYLPIVVYDDEERELRADLARKKKERERIRLADKSQIEVPPAVQSSELEVPFSFFDVISTLLDTTEAQSARAREQLERIEEDFETRSDTAVQAEAKAESEEEKIETRRRQRLATQRMQQVRSARFWWNEIFVPGRMLPFRAIFIDGSPDEDKMLLLYRIRKGFHSRQPLHPAPCDLREDQLNLIPYAYEQWFTFSIDGGAFVAFDAPRDQAATFFRNVLPGHLSDQYFLLFLLALHQRFALMRLTEQVARNWISAETREAQVAREKVFSGIHNSLLMFAARGNFVQVMQRDNHHRCYQKWQETFQVDALYREVNDEVRVMHHHIQTELSKRIEQAQEEQQAISADFEKRVTQISVCLGVPALVLSFLGINIRGINMEGMHFFQALEIAVASFVLGIVLVVIILAFARKRAHRHHEVSSH